MEEHLIEHLTEILTESLLHTGTMLPLLFLVFLLVEAVSHRSTSSRVTNAFSHPFIGPITAAALGLIPQCGFSVVATTLFLEGMIPIGSLLSAYISTSDEALPIMIADRASLPWVIPLLATKLVWGTMAGICVNAAFLHKAKSKISANASDAHGQTYVTRASPKIDPGQNQQNADKELRQENHKSDKLHRAAQNVGHGHIEKHATLKSDHSNCGHSYPNSKPNLAQVASHALSRTLSTASMVFVLSALFNFIGHVAQGKISAVLSKPGLWQPVVAAVVGLVPSCATSVVLAEGFRSGILSFPATISGLTSNSGLGLLVLIKESKRKSEVITVVALLIITAVLAAIFASIILPTGYMSHSGLGWLSPTPHM